MSPSPTAHNLESTHSQVFHDAPFMGKRLTGSPVRAGSSLLHKTNHLDPNTISMQPLASLHCRAAPEYTKTQRSLKSVWSMSRRSLLCLQISDSRACPIYSPQSWVVQMREIWELTLYNSVWVSRSSGPTLYVFEHFPVLLASCPVLPTHQQHGPQPFVILYIALQMFFSLRTRALSQHSKWHPDSRF